MRRRPAPALSIATGRNHLNPMELVWGNLKAAELANLCPDALDEAATAAHSGLHRIGSSYQLCLNFLDNTGLRL